GGWHRTMMPAAAPAVGESRRYGGRRPVASLQAQHGVAGEGLDADLALALPIAVLEARAGAEAFLVDRRPGRLEPAAEALAPDARGQVLGQGDADVAADRLRGDPAPAGQRTAEVGVAGHAAAVQPL